MATDMDHGLSGMKSEKRSMMVCISEVKNGMDNLEAKIMSADY